jgi:D-serine deaminase-like pyridoxal phosphate-dependent protein
MRLTPCQADALGHLPTPSAVVDAALVQRHIERLQQRIASLGAALRPHVKTAKSIEIAGRQRDAGAVGIAVSTLEEARDFHAAGFDDILYAVGLPPGRVAAAAALASAGCRLTVVVDSVEAAEAVAMAPQSLDVLVEIDSDGDRAGIPPDAAARLLAVADRLRGKARLRGVMTHAGSSYHCRTAAELEAVAERERLGAVRAAERLRANGHRCDVVSVGSTPTALSARRLDGVTEVRAGVYVFQDLVMRSVGVADVDDIALAVLSTVIGHRHDRRQAFIDAGWTALSRDPGADPARHGFGLVCDLSGRPIEGLVIVDTNQEHGVVGTLPGSAADPLAMPIGSQWLVLPNHACATAAQFSAYQVPGADGSVARWTRCGGR